MTKKINTKKTSSFSPSVSAEAYHYDTTTKKRKPVIAETGYISIALARNISAYKEADPELFDQVDGGGKLREIDQKHLIDRAGKPIYLTKYQTKIIYALSLMLSQDLGDEDIQDYIINLRSRRNSSSPITRTIPITPLTKMVELDGKARARQKEKVIKELQALADIKQVQTFKVEGTEDGLIRYAASLILIPEQLEDLSPDKNLDMDVMNISFGSIFFWELLNRYAIIKPSLFSIWGRAGSGTDTELFNILLSDLLAKYSGHRNAALKASNAIKRSKYKDNDSYYAAIKATQKNALTYSEYAFNIRRRVTTDYESTRKQKADFWTHLTKAIDALKKLGLLTDAVRTSTDKGERIDFIFDMDYNKNELGESITIAGELGDGEVETSLPELAE